MERMMGFLSTAVQSTLSNPILTALVVSNVGVSASLVAGYWSHLKVRVRAERAQNAREAHDAFVIEDDRLVQIGTTLLKFSDENRPTKETLIQLGALLKGYEKFGQTTPLLIYREQVDQVLLATSKGGDAELKNITLKPDSLAGTLGANVEEAMGKLFFSNVEGSSLKEALKLLKKAMSVEPSATARKLSAWNVKHYSLREKSIKIFTSEYPYRGAVLGVVVSSLASLGFGTALLKFGPKFTVAA
jgi:ribosomal protein L12E/L44/L45/RPP1/RPP2